MSVATLRELRVRHHLTQEQLAVAADVSPSTVYHIEAGKVQPRPSIVRRLARALQPIRKVGAHGAVCDR